MFAREGIEGAVAARTSISLIKGAECRLAYRGYAVGELAETASFEEVIYLLWLGELPTRKALVSFSDQLKASRDAPQSVIETIRPCVANSQPIDALRTALSILASTDPDLNDNSEAADLRKGVRVTAAMPTLTALQSRFRRKLDPIPPDPKLGHAENFLYMLSGAKPSLAESQAMNAAMILHADHGFDASTFAARVTAGTRADLHSALISAIGTLKGPLHGGALRDVIEMLLAIGDKSKAKGTIDQMLKAKKKIPGFGHPIYKGMDPRAVQLKRICERLSTGTGKHGWFELSSCIEDIVHRRTGLNPNVDFYCAPTYHMLGVAPEDLAPAFACARTPGWVAHVIEQHLDNRLIRLLEEYIGLLPRAFVPIDDRV